MAVTALYLDVVPDDLFDELRVAAGDGIDLRRIDSTDPAHLRERISGCEYVLVGHVHAPGELLRAAGPGLRLVQKLGRGVDIIDLPTAAELGAMVAVTSGGNARYVAEHTIMLILASLRRLEQCHATIRAGGWGRQDVRYTLRGLADRRVALIGLGHIGRAVAQRLRGFETDVVYVARHADEAAERDLGVRRVEFNEALETADVVSLHVPLNDATRGLIGAEQLRRMRSGAVLINTSRGPIVDEAALAAALEAGEIAGAGLDVYEREPLPADSPLRTSPAVVLTPHIAGSARENVLRVAEHGLANIRLHAAGRPLPAGDIITDPTEGA